MQPLISPISIILILLTVIIWFLFLQKPKIPTLYDRLGGVYNIAAVINRFSDQVLLNPKVGIDSPNPFLRKWSREKLDRLPGLKFMRTLWVCDITGGPYKFMSTRNESPGLNYSNDMNLNLKNAHCDLHITSDEFNEVAKELSNALDYYKVPEQEKSEVLNAFAGHKNEVTACPFFKH